MLSFCDEIQRVGDRQSNAGLISSSVVFLRRTPSSDCEIVAKDAAQRRIGGERPKERLAP